MVVNISVIWIFSSGCRKVCHGGTCFCSLHAQRSTFDESVGSNLRNINTTSTLRSHPACKAHYITQSNMCVYGRSRCTLTFVGTPFMLSTWSKSFIAWSHSPRSSCSDARRSRASIAYDTEPPTLFLSISSLHRSMRLSKRPFRKSWTARMYGLQRPKS